MEYLNIVFNDCKKDKSFFPFQIILATGAKVDIDYKEDSYKLSTFDLLPVFISFDKKVFFFQHLITYGKNFSLKNNNDFFKECDFNQDNEFYVDPEYYIDDNANFYDYNENSIVYYNLEAELDKKNMTYEDIIAVALSTVISKTDTLVVVHKPGSKLTGMRDEKILNQISKTNFIDQIKDYVRKNFTMITKIEQSSNFKEDIFGGEVKATFFVVDGFIKMTE
jgi:hypothetical protein